MTKVLHGLDAVQCDGVVLTIGNFDGVHVGHQAILSAGRVRAEAAGTQLVAMTFDPHPAAILAPDRTPKLLTPIPERLRQLSAAGAQTIVVVQSHPDFFALPADRFIDEVVMARFNPIAMVEGASFHYGAHRQGTPETLTDEGKRCGFDVEIVEPVRVPLGGNPGTVISSSLIRHLLNSGTVDQVKQCLGRPYALLGKVEHGAGRGQGLGFPTANLHVENQLIPAQGVYAGRSFLLSCDPNTDSEDNCAPPESSAPIATAVSIGRTPTFEDDDTLLVEAHLLDYEGDLYGRYIRLELLDWLRPQEKFSSPEALHDQIAIDVARIRAMMRPS